MKGKARSLFNKAFLSIIVLSLLIPSSLSFAQSSSDIAGHWAEKTLQEWLEKGYITGYDDGKIKPDRDISRAEFFTLINRVFGFEEKADIAFSDSEPSDWHYNQIAIAVKAGYAEGYEDGTIMPNQSVTRQETAAVVARLLELEDYGTTSRFNDADSIGAWAVGYVSGVRESGIMVGFPDETFKPSKMTSRAEAVATLQKAVQIVEGTTIYSSPTLYGPEQSNMIIDGDVVIGVSGITLQNATISGDLVLDEQIGEGDAWLTNVTVLGTLTVAGGGSESIHVKNSKFNKVDVKKRNGKVRLAFSGKSTIGSMSIFSGVKVEGEGDADIDIDNVQLHQELPEGSSVELEGSIGNLTVSSSGSSVSLGNGQIEELEVDENSEQIELDIKSDAKVRKAHFNGKKAKVSGAQNVEDASVNADGVSFDKKPGKLTVKDGIDVSIDDESSSDNEGEDGSAGPIIVPGPGSGGGNTPGPTPPADNLTGTIVFETDNAPIEEGLVWIYSYADEDYYSAEVVDGEFSIQLADGDYRITTVSSNRLLHLLAPVEFTVGPDEANEITIVVYESNITISGILFDDGSEVELARLNVFNLDTVHVYGLDIVDGRINAYLPDGEYLIFDFIYSVDGPDFESIFYQKNKLFSVENGVSNLESIELPVLYPVSFTITYEEEQGGVKTIEISQGTSTQYYDASNPYPFYLPAGEFTITKLIDVFDEEYPVHIEITIVAEGENEIEIDFSTLAGSED